LKGFQKIIFLTTSQELHSLNKLGKAGSNHLANFLFYMLLKALIPEPFTSIIERSSNLRTYFLKENEY